MSRPTAKLRNVAKRILTHERQFHGPFTALTPVSFGAIDRLRPHLANLMGTGGVRALLQRSLALSKGDAPWVCTVEVNANGSLESREQQLESTKRRESEDVVLAHVLGLMEAFIGENLTMRLIQEAWPKVPLAAPDLGRGGKNAEEK